MTLDPTLSAVLSDWLINLSAGLFAAAFVIPATTRRPIKHNQFLVMINLVGALAYFLAGYILK